MDLNTRRVSSVRQSFQPLGVQWAEEAGDHIAGLASGELGRGERRRSGEDGRTPDDAPTPSGQGRQGAVERAGGQEVPREDEYRGQWRTGEEGR